MNLFDQTPLNLYLLVVFGLAAVSTVAAVGVMADAAARMWRSKHRNRAHREVQRDRFGHGVRPDSQVVSMSKDATQFSPSKK